MNPLSNSVANDRWEECSRMLLESWLHNVMDLDAIRSYQNPRKIIESVSEKVIPR